MDFFKAKLITSVFAFGLITGALIGMLLYYQFPQYYPHWYGGILAFFLILETLIISYVVSASKKVTQRQMLNTYMLTKVVKVFAALIFVAIIVKENIKSFVLIFMIFYLLFLAMESMLFLKIEKRLKNKQQ